MQRMAQVVFSYFPPIELLRFLSHVAQANRPILPVSQAPVSLTIPSFKRLQHQRINSWNVVEKGKRRV